MLHYLISVNNINPPHKIDIFFSNDESHDDPACVHDALACIHDARDHNDHIHDDLVLCGLHNEVVYDALHGVLYGAYHGARRSGLHDRSGHHRRGLHGVHNDHQRRPKQSRE